MTRREGPVAAPVSSSMEHNKDGLRVQIFDADTMIIRRRHEHE